jgi:hypothetical protein
MPWLCKQGVRGSSPLGSTISPCQRHFRHPKKLSKAQVQQQSTATVREQVMMLAVVFEPLADAFSAGKSSRWSLGCMHPSVTAIWLWRSICMLGPAPRRPPDPRPRLLHPQQRRRDHLVLHGPHRWRSGHRPEHLLWYRRVSMSAIAHRRLSAWSPHPAGLDGGHAAG